MDKHIEETTVTTKRDKGFTLVELLIVIVILGILATVTVFAVRGITDRGQTSACDTEKKTLQTAVEAYFANNGGSTIPNGGATNDPAGTLVATGLIHSAPTLYNILTDGSLTNTGTKCGGSSGSPVSG